MSRGHEMSEAAERIRYSFSRKMPRRSLHEEPVCPSLHVFRRLGRAVSTTDRSRTKTTLRGARPVCAPCRPAPATGRAQDVWGRAPALDRPPTPHAARRRDVRADGHLPKFEGARPVDPQLRPRRGGQGPRPTPAVDGDRGTANSDTLQKRSVIAIASRPSRVASHASFSIGPSGTRPTTPCDST